MEVKVNKRTENEESANEKEKKVETSDVKGIVSEKEEEIDNTETYRASAAIAFAVILIVVGFPLWWKTTTVYRVPLPYSRINDLEDFDIAIKLNIFVSSVVNNNTETTENYSTELKDFFKKSKLFRPVISTYFLKAADIHFFKSCKKFEDCDTYFSQHIKTGNILLLEVSGFVNSQDDIIVGKHRTLYYSPGVSAYKLYSVLQEYLLRENSMLNMIQAVTNPTEVSSASRDHIVRRRIPASNKYDILITVINPDPELSKLHWNVREAVENYIDPFISKLSLLADYKVKSQWLYFMTFKFNFQPISDGWSISENVLPYIITPVEKRLASHISENPVLNFVVYTPECNRSPLYITRNNEIISEEVQAFLSPRWGGMIFHSPSSDLCHQNISTPVDIFINSESVMGVILEQLRLLVGIPKLQKVHGTKILAQNNTDLRQWELDFLLRFKTWEQLASARITLISLSQLLGEISNIVIDDHVGESIFHAVDNVELAAKFLQTGDIEKAFLSSKVAFLTAESAFTDPSLLALLYFPDDQKYAVYIPLFLPVMIPVLMSLKSIFTFIHKISTRGNQN